MEPEKEAVEPVIDDEAELDRELNESLNGLKAGKAPEATAPVNAEASTEEKPEKASVEDTSKPPDKNKEDDYEYRIPNQGKFESDESFEKRTELLDLVKKRRLATTPEAKQQLSDQIKETKGQLKELNSPDKINNPNSNVDVDKVDEDPILQADRERLKALGGATREDIQDILQQERFIADQTSTLKNFVERSKEMKDEDVREVFFAFVDANYNWQGKTGKDLMTVLELARENMFKPSESIQERVLKGADVQEKINAMQFPGGTGNKVEHSSEMRKDIDELKSTGMSEEKAIELLSDN